MKYRWIHMNGMLFDSLQDQWKTRLPQSDYVFQNRDSRHPRYGDRYIARRRFMKGLCKRAGVKTFGFHALRRFFGSLLADKYKESIPVIQKLLGHASPNTTEKYIYNISQDAKRAVDQIKFEIKIPEQKQRS
jgi:integrase